MDLRQPATRRDSSTTRTPPCRTERTSYWRSLPSNTPICSLMSGGGKKGERGVGRRGVFLVDQRYLEGVRGRNMVCVFFVFFFVSWGRGYGGCVCLITIWGNSCAEYGLQRCVSVWLFYAFFWYCPCCFVLLLFPFSLCKRERGEWGVTWCAVLKKNCLPPFSLDHKKSVVCLKIDMGVSSFFLLCFFFPLFVFVSGTLSQEGFVFQGKFFF